MKSIALPLLALGAVSATAAFADAKSEVESAAAALAASPNYSWTATVTVPDDARFRPGPTEGKTVKDGPTHVVMTFGDNTTEAVIQGEKRAVSRREGGWFSLADLEQEDGPARFLGTMLRNIQTPADQIKDLASKANELKKDGEVYLADMTEAGAKDLLSFRRRPGGAAPDIFEPKGSMKFWIKDGVVSKYEFHVQGVVEFNGNDVDVDRKTTIVIKDVGKTQVEIPEEAKKKLS